MRAIAFYLPQFHEIPENNEWWGDGFTEWHNVRSARPLFEGHRQPREPLEGDYYDLADHDVMRRQIDLAREYGLYGFCFYHYWFDGHLLLERPLEALLRDTETRFPFCICWANEHWTNAWVDGGTKVLIEQRYGGEDEWRAHFDYLRPFLTDPDYITNDGRPLLVIYRPEIIPRLNEMLDYWQTLARAAGLPGIDFAYQHVSFKLSSNYDSSRFAYELEYQPVHAESLIRQRRHRRLRRAARRVFRLLETRFRTDLRSVASRGLRQVSYDEVWRAILDAKPDSPKAVPGAFVDWDNTPRKGNRGTVYIGATPSSFRAYLTEQLRRAREVYASDMLFVFAWNEWAEGGYLEPDSDHQFAYLEALRDALRATDEWPPPHPTEDAERRGGS